MSPSQEEFELVDEAADEPSPAAAGKPDPLAGAHARIAQRDWAGAITELQRVNATDSADWNNLMGFSLRKQVLGADVQ